MRRGAILAAALATGCTLLPKRVDSVRPAAGPQRVDCRGFSLGERGKATLTAQAFGERVTSLLQAGRSFSAAAYVERHPDVALEALRSPPAGMSAQAIAFAERAHDGQCGNRGGPAWNDRRVAAAPLVAAVAAPSPAPEDGEKALRLCRAAEGTAGAIDGCRAAALAHLGGDRPKEATAVLETGLKATSERPYEAAGLLVLYAESLRRNEQTEPGAAAWARAATAAAALLDRPHGVRDPLLWERLAAQRQVQVPWPAEVRPALLRSVGAAGLPVADGEPDEAVLWTAVGTWWLDRNEPHAALTAFKRAETLTADEPTRAMLQVWQAKAMAQAGLAPTATALLVPLCDHPHPFVAGPALSALGAIKLQGGTVRQARGLLERAEALPAQWPGKASGTANLALALFLEGEEAKGLERLHAAQNAFRAAGDLAELLLALKNEADYWADRGNKKRAEEVRTHVAHIEETGTDS